MSQNDEYHKTEDDASPNPDKDDEIPVENLTDKNTTTTTYDSKHDADNQLTCASSDANDEAATASSDIAPQDNHELSPDLSQLLEAEQAKSAEYEQKLHLALADYQNLSKRTASEIDSRVLQQMSDVMTSLIDIRDDFIRAKDAFTKDSIDSSGLDSILRNMDSVFAKYEVNPIDALGEIFDPNMHEAISVQTDPSLDDSTIVRELRRGYTFRNTIIRPSMVVISKKE